MGLGDILAGVAGIVTGVTPTTAATYRFVRHQPQSRGLLVASTRTRTFDVLAGAPLESDRTSDGTVTHQVHDVAVQVVYPLAAWRSRDEMGEAMAEDTAALCGALRPPSAWSTFASELYVLGNQVGRDEVIGTDGEPVSIIITIPLIAHAEV